MTTPIDFTAPYQMPDGRWIYGAAAANRRAADAGGYNQLAYELVMAGITIGFNNAMAANRSKR
ncbi:hypothetical protein [Pseudomonas kilonensis]|uniref:hypothetical protein n=1 Tax=Pseudomonas kilonensis TaxID=132476 RepID=UPI00209D2B22|nr:hypothetical protein [Pseudomonas kilonensis]MCP1456991.1 hypothetical protein [Pseudomonas kilonensis]